MTEQKSSEGLSDSEAPDEAELQEESASDSLENLSRNEEESSPTSRSSDPEGASFLRIDPRVVIEVRAELVPLVEGADGVVVPVGASGSIGQRGTQLVSEFQRQNIPTTFLTQALTDGPSQPTTAPASSLSTGSLRPAAPRAIDLSEGGHSTLPSGLPLRWIIFATGQTYNSLESDLSGARRIATGAAIETAAQRGVRHLALPVLGLGNDAVPLTTAARDTALGISQALDTMSGELTLKRLTLIVPPKSDVSSFVRAAEEATNAISLEMLRDRPITDAKQDKLRFADYAFALATVIDHPAAETPLTIAVNAPWGAGKTSIAELTAQELTEYPRNGLPAIICWFNAWQNDDAQRMATPLAATVARTVGPLRSPWRRLFDPLPTTLLTPRQKRRRRFASGTFFLLAALFLWLLTAVEGRSASSLLGVGSVVALLAGIGPQALSLRSTASDVATLVRSPETTFSSGSLSEVSDDLGRLIHQATQRGRNRAHRRLVVFVDDIERCEPPRSIEVCEAVNHLLSHEDVVVVLLGDLQTIATAAETKYHDLLPRNVGSRKSGLQSYGELYLEKVIQFRFDVPRLDRTQFAHLVGELLGPAPHEADEVGVIRPLPVRVVAGMKRKYLSRIRPVIFPRRDRKRAERERQRAEAVAHGEPDGGHPADARILEIARRISRLERIEGPEYLSVAYLAAQPYIQPKPRDIKRLLNRVRFCLAIADRRGLLAPDGPLSAEAIGKWSVVVERWPDVSAAIGQDPSLLRSLEGVAAKAREFNQLCSSTIPRTPNLESLRGLVSCAPQIGALSEVLTGFTTPDG